MDGAPIGEEGAPDDVVPYAGGGQVPDHGGAISRIKDIAQLQSARDNQLVGYGLVIGLQGSGDSLRNSPFTEQSIRAMLENLGIATEGGQARAKNVAAVIVTANLPPFVQSGARIDVSVSSLGDATSLAGGTLVMTPLKAADGEIYAVAQGPVFISGFSAQGEAEQVTQGVPTAGRVPNGAIIERQVEADFANQSTPGPAAQERRFLDRGAHHRRDQRLFVGSASASASPRSGIRAPSSSASRTGFPPRASTPSSKTSSLRPTRRPASSSTSAPARSSSATTCASRASRSAMAR